MPVREDVTVPVRGIRLHPGPRPSTTSLPARYCPREGYKVASLSVEKFSSVDIVTVPVRGIRLHRQKCTNANL